MRGIDQVSPRLMDLSRARSLMEAEGIDVIIAHSDRNLYYTSEFPWFDRLTAPTAKAYSIIPRSEKKEAYLIIPHSDRMVLQEFPSWIPNRLFYGYYYIKGAPEYSKSLEKTPLEALVRALSELEVLGARIGVERELLPISVYDDLQKALPEAELVGCDSVLQRLRTIKSAEEIERLRKVAEMAEKAIHVAFEKAQPGMTELDVDKMIRGSLVEQGADICYLQLGSGSRTATSGVYPGDKVIRKGDILMVDVAAVHERYVSDVCRYAVFGKPSEEQKRYHAITFEAFQKAISAVKPGLRVSDLFRIGSQVPLEAGIKDFYRHHIGHGLGLQVHEWPYLAPWNDQFLEENMVLAVEVPYMIHDLGMFGTEDTIVVTEKGYELLTHPQPELISL